MLWWISDLKIFIQKSLDKSKDKFRTFPKYIKPSGVQELELGHQFPSGSRLFALGQASSRPFQLERWELSSSSSRCIPRDCLVN